jgi:hypothetical protein
MSKARLKPSWSTLADAPEVLTVPETAYIARTCERTIRAEIAAGRLRACHFGRALRITKVALIEFLEGR